MASSIMYGMLAASADIEPSGSGMAQTQPSIEPPAAGKASHAAVDVESVLKMICPSKVRSWQPAGESASFTVPPYV